jgi:HEAT repeat protein
VLAPPPLPRTVEASFRDLSAARPEVRVSSIEDLARHATRDPAVRARAIALLERALKDDVSGVRAAAAVALADVKAREVLPALQLAIEDADGHVRQMALAALGEIGDPRAAPRLKRALSDERPEVRYQAVIAYARVAKDDRADVLAALLAAMSDTDDSVRYIALRLIEERVDEGDTDGLEGIRARAEELLSLEPRHVAVVAAILLAKLGSDEAKRVVLSVTDGTWKMPRGPSQEDEREAVELTGVLGMTEAIPALERRAFGLKRRLTDTCAYAATIALARLGHSRARQTLLRQLRSARRETREGAVVAVGRARMVEARAIVAGLTAHDASPEIIARTLAELGS